MADINDLEKILLKIAKLLEGKNKRANRAESEGTDPISRFSSLVGKLADAFNKLASVSNAALSRNVNNSSNSFQSANFARKVSKLSTGGLDAFASSIEQALGGDQRADTTKPLAGKIKDVLPSSRIGEAFESIGGVASKITSTLTPIAESISEFVVPVIVIGTVVKTVATYAYKIIDFIVELPFNIKNWSDSLLKSQEYLKEFSSTIAGVFNRKEIFETLQNIRIGEATGTSAGNLEKAYESLSTALEPINIILANIYNEALTTIVQLMSVAVDIMRALLNDILTVLQAMLELFTLFNNGNQQILDWLRGKDAQMTSPVEGFLRNYAARGNDIRAAVGAR